MTKNNPLLVSIVMPCLNEEAGISSSINKAQQAIRKNHWPAEIIIADNGSTDNSITIARRMGAKVVCQPLKGYGNAYHKGFASARGKYLVMGDSDDTYDFRETNRFIDYLDRGYDLVIGNRFGGKMAKGAMSWSHRFVGNPILSGILRLMFHTKISDSHCGMRAFTREAYDRLNLKTSGMEYASEMVIRSLQEKLKITQVPISYRIRKGESKLLGFKDAWRHLRFMLLYSPNYLFLAPGFFFFLIGLIVEMLIVLVQVDLFGHILDLHSMIIASMLMLLGFQIILTGLYAKIFAYTQGLVVSNHLMPMIFKYFNLERGLFLGGILAAGGLLIDLVIFVTWAGNNYGPLSATKNILLANTLSVLGFQILFSSFMFSMLGITEKKK